MDWDPGTSSRWRWPWRTAPPPRRLAIIVAAATFGGIAALAASQLLLLVTRCNGGCAVATDPFPLVILFAAVAGWSAASGTRG